jgi:hypothetical protein
MQGGTWSTSFQNLSFADSQIGITASTLGYIYRIQGDEESAIDMLILASMADIRSSNKERWQR